jgi:hypothetical protein
MRRQARRKESVVPTCEIFYWVVKILCWLAKISDPQFTWYLEGLNNRVELSAMELFVSTNSGTTGTWQVLSAKSVTGVA